MRQLARGLVVCLLAAAGCAAPQTSNIMVEPHPLTGVSTAYATVFLAEDGTRLVLSAPVESAAPVGVTLWLPATSATSGCDEPSMQVGEHAVRPASVEARVLETPSGSDQTVEFELPPAVLRTTAREPTRVHACGGEWSFDDEDRGVVREFLGAVDPHAPTGINAGR